MLFIFHLTCTASSTGQLKNETYSNEFTSVLMVKRVMELDSIYGGYENEHDGISFVEISPILVTLADFLISNDVI